MTLHVECDELLLTITCDFRVLHGVARQRSSQRSGVSLATAHNSHVFGLTEVGSGSGAKVSLAFVYFFIPHYVQTYMYMNTEHVTEHVRGKFFLHIYMHILLACLYL